ncbi:putative N-methyl-L-amino acid oxidase [Candida maltosa Xu316]|uniref:Putative N-methyl-L-amino acid oxidase n=1 Tax=Candida maltosa (strain Xu316) TaxID=1245528 RepID=M3ITR7_CANMX|nr:putative N-methyl-L-amino acid oxidase [Candida maltosa Xu316]
MISVTLSSLKVFSCVPVFMAKTHTTNYTIGSISLAFISSVSDSLEKYSNPEVVCSFPNLLQSWVIETRKILSGEPLFKQFQCLEILTLRYANMDFLRCVPLSVSRLKIDEYYANNGPDPTDPV